MEKYSLLGTLKVEAENNGWVFLSGDDFYQNYESVMYEYEPDQHVLGCDFIASDQYNESGVLVGINYIGSIRFGRKKDSDDIQVSLDETFIQKHERRLKELKITLSDFISNFACSNQLSITNSVGLLEINKFDANIDFVGLQITFNQEDFTIIPETYTVDLSSGDNGTATSSLGSEDDSPFIVNKNTNVAFYADVDAGWKFGSWLVNGAVNLLNPLALTITRNYTIVAQFVESVIKQLTIAVSGNGTTNPTPGNYDYDAGSIVPITAIENDDNYFFDEFTVDGTPDSNNPVIVTVNENTNVVVYFNEWYQRVVLSGSNNIVTINNLHYFQNQTSIGNVSNFQIKNTQVGTFDGVGSEVLANIYFDENTNIRLHVNIKQSMLDNYKSPFSIVGKNIYLSSSNTQWFIRYSGINVTVTPTGNQPVPSVGWHIYELINKKYYVNGILIYDMSAAIVTPDANAVLSLGSINNVSYSECQYQYCKVDNQLEYYFQRGNGLQIDDASGNGNHGTFTGGIVDDFWANKSEFAYPISIEKGYDKYESDTTPGQFQYVIYDDLGQPVETSVTGYTKILSVPPNSGISDNENTYSQPIGNVPLFTLSQAHAALNIFYTDLNTPNDVTYSQLKALDVTGIPDNEFRIDNDTDFITEIKSSDIT